MGWKEHVPAPLEQLADSCEAAITQGGFYVYYLWNGGEIVYVGQTTRGASRIAGHTVGKWRKEFDGVMFRRCSSFSEMMDLEDVEIRRLQPRYNKRRAKIFRGRPDEDSLDNVTRVSWLLASLLLASETENDSEQVS